MKIGIFGGTFNPVHYGHLRAAEEVREKLRLDKILFIPAKNPPLKTKDIATAEHRYELLKLALRGNRYFELSDIEYRLKGKSYTAKTILELQKIYPPSDFFFILGIDAFLDIPHWWNPEKLITLTNFAVISRPGFRFTDLKTSPYIKEQRRVLGKLDEEKAELYEAKLPGKKKAVLLRITPMEIASTEIRRLLRQGKSIKYLLPPEVKSYIIFNKLYTH